MNLKKSIRIIHFLAFCEGFLYFGMKALLLGFLTFRLKLDKPDLVFHGFSMFLHMMSLLIWGILSSHIGKYATTITCFSLVSTGSFFVAFFSTGILPPTYNFLLYIGLLVITCGIGGLKAILIPFGCDQFPAEDNRLPKNNFISKYYYISNIGALTSFSLTLLHRRKFNYLGINMEGYPLCFGIVGLVASLAYYAFLFGTSHYKTDSVRRRSSLKELKEKVRNIYIDPFLNPPEPGRTHEDNKNFARSVFYIVLFTGFGIVFHEMGPSWIFQAISMKHDLGYKNLIIKEDQMFFSVPALILILFPFRFLVKSVAEDRKVAYGLTLASTSFLLAGLLDWYIKSNDGVMVSILWQLPQYFVMSIAEMLIVVNGLECFFFSVRTELHAIVWLFWLICHFFCAALPLMVLQTRSLLILLFSGFSLAAPHIFPEFF